MRLWSQSLEYTFLKQHDFYWENMVPCNIKSAIQRQILQQSNSFSQMLENNFHGNEFIQSGLFCVWFKIY